MNRGPEDTHILKTLESIKYPSIKQNDLNSIRKKWEVRQAETTLECDDTRI